MDNELILCPFCGEKHEWETGEDFHYGSGNFIICKNRILMQAYNMAEIDSRARHWNTRPIEDALRAELAVLKEAARWIPVEERLPEINVEVLTIYWTFGGGGVPTIRVLLDTGMWFCGDNGYLCPPNNITHWRYITPPELQ